jgi:hypothetical protein
MLRDWYLAELRNPLRGGIEPFAGTRHVRSSKVDLA